MDFRWNKEFHLLFVENQTLYNFAIMKFAQGILS
jgi:hypothetical protein